MKKLLLSLGTIAAVVAPVATVMACGSTESAKDKAIDEAKKLLGYDKMNAKNKKQFDADVAKQSLKELQAKIKAYKEELKNKKNGSNSGGTQDGSGTKVTGTEGSETEAPIDGQTDCVDQSGAVASQPTDGSDACATQAGSKTA